MSRAFFSWYTRFEIRSFALLLPTLLRLDFAYINGIENIDYVIFQACLNNFVRNFESLKNPQLFNLPVFW